MTEYVVRYLKIGKAVGLKIPVIKHITTKLINSLEEHLREETKDKEVNLLNRSKIENHLRPLALPVVTITTAMTRISL